MADSPCQYALLARIEIEDVLRRYCRSLDRNDGLALKSVSYPDATCDFGIFKGRFHAFADWIAEQFSEMNNCMHMIGNVAIDVQGAIAFAETYCLSVWDAGQAQQVIYGRFIDRFEKRQDAWLIAHRLLVYDVSRVERCSSAFGTTMGDAILRGRRDNMDPSFLDLKRLA